MIEGRTVPDEAVQGFKKSDYVGADKVLGQDVRIEELPDGIKFYLKGQAVNLSEKRILVKLYELVKEGDGLKLRRDFLEKFMNRIPEEDEIALRYGPSEEGYIWIAKWRDQAGEKGIISETIRVSEKWRARYEEAQRKARGETVPSATPQAASAPAPSSFGPMDMIKFMQDGEDRAIRNMKMMAEIFNGNKRESPADVLKDAYAGAVEIMQRATETNLDMVKRVKNTSAKNMEAEAAAAAATLVPVDDDDDDETTAGDPMAGVPAFIRPFLPQLEQWLGTLIGGGPMGAAVKTLIVSSEQWKEIFNDPDKFGQAVSAMEMKFGSERTEKAMDILLNRRAKGKGKGK